MKFAISKAGYAMVLALAACSFDTSGIATDAALIDAPPAPDAPPGQPDASADALLPDADLPDVPMPTSLVNTGLVVRYFIDEAAFGTGPSALLDSAPNPLDMALYYNDSKMNFTEVSGNRGLQWGPIAAGTRDRASVPADGNKIGSALNGSQTGTIEVVVDWDTLHDDGTRFSHIGAGTDRGLFTLRNVENTNRLQFSLNNAGFGEWDVGIEGGGRMVLHVVFDSHATTVGRKVKLYKDGLEVTPVSEPMPSPGAMISIGNNKYYVIGNRENGDRAGQGIIFYAAMYSAALSPAEVAQNAAVLAVNDDAP